MIDHVLGRPSVAFRKYQVFAVVAFWATYLWKGNRHGLPGSRRLSKLLTSRLTAWQTVITTLLWLYVARNFGKLVGLECPEPLANLYTKSFFRATWALTALDAGFWSAMHIKRKWARDILSIVFSVYYLICAEQADEKARKIRSVLTLEHIRVAWNKPNTPYLAFGAWLLRPSLMKYKPRAIRIPRPQGSSYTEPVEGWLYFDGPLSALRKHTKLVLNFHGGGFIAMNPRAIDDALLAWAGKTGLPVLSIDYRKAPEYPYPYALNECYDVYNMIIGSRGRCVGLSGDTVPRIVVSGDSAGGNLATSLTLMILQAGSTETRKWLGEESLPPPAGLVLIYPALDMNIGNWMTDEQMSLIRDRSARKTNQRIIRHKSGDFHKLAPNTPIPSEDEDDNNDRTTDVFAASIAAEAAAKPDGKATISTSSEGDRPLAQLRTRLATPSLISYVSDRVLSPEMMRAIIILYIGPHNRPDFSTEFLLSPVLAPESLLAQFPKTYFLTGERDPLVDDTVIMAGRIRAAKLAQWRERRELGLLSRDERRRGFDDNAHVEVSLIEGISHGFFQFASLFPESWKYIYRVGKWYEELFAEADRNAANNTQNDAVGNATAASLDGGLHLQGRHHNRTGTSSTVDEERPLEMSSNKPRPSSSTANSPGQGSSGPAGAPNKGPGRIELPPRALENEEDDSTAHPTPYPAESLARDHPLGRKDRNKSQASLQSEDDLLSRRMKGLVGGLTSSRPD